MARTSSCRLQELDALMQGGRAIVDDGPARETAEEFMGRLQQWRLDILGYKHVAACTHFGVVRSLLWTAGLHPVPQQIAYATVYRVSLT